MDWQYQWTRLPSKEKQYRLQDAIKARNFVLDGFQHEVALSFNPLEVTTDREENPNTHEISLTWISQHREHPDECDDYRKLETVIDSDGNRGEPTLRQAPGDHERHLTKKMTPEFIFARRTVISEIYTHLEDALSKEGPAVSSIEGVIRVATREKDWNFTLYQGKDGLTDRLVVYARAFKPRREGHSPEYADRELDDADQVRPLMQGPQGKETPVTGADGEALHRGEYKLVFDWSGMIPYKGSCSKTWNFFSKDIRTLAKGYQGTTKKGKSLVGSPKGLL